MTHSSQESAALYPVLDAVKTANAVYLLKDAQHLELGLSQGLPAEFFQICIVHNDEKEVIS